MKTSVPTCAPGPYLFENGFDREPTRQWCNAHIAPIGSKVCARAAITIDTEHPKYGALATLHYPSDRWPFVVLGGSKSGKTLYFAPVDTTNLESGATITKEYALANYRLARTMTLRQSHPDAFYGKNMTVGYADFHLAREL